MPSLASRELIYHAGSDRYKNVFFAKDNLAQKGMRIKQRHFYAGQRPVGIITRRMRAIGVLFGVMLYLITCGF